MSNKSEIKLSIMEVGDAKIFFNGTSRSYFFNNIEPRDIPLDYFEELYQKFESNLLVQARDTLSLKLLNSYIKKTKKVSDRLIEISNGHRVDFLFKKRDNLISNESESNHDDIKRIISTQKTVLNRILLKLYDLRDIIKLENSDATNSIEKSLMNENSNIETNTISFKDSGRATFKLSKKESLMLLYILDKCELLSFESDDQRKIFIESNFNFIEVRANKNQGESFPMKGISSEISTFKSRIKDDVDSNNKTLEKLLKKLNETIHFFEFK